MKFIIRSGFVMLLLMLLAAKQMQAQPYSCTFKPPVVKIDFGAGDIPEVNSVYLSHYRRAYGTCPNDGFYSFTAHTDNCFNGDWFTINQDHSSTKPNGNMMLVNASETGGVFFSANFFDFPGSTTFQLSVWMMNVCKLNGGCPALPPNITISLTTPAGRKIGFFRTGILAQGSVPLWRKYTGIFQTPPGITSFRLEMENKTLGGCGNDFALDDLTISECLVPKVQVKKNPLPVKKQPAAQQPPAVKKTPEIKTQPAPKLPVNPTIILKDSFAALPKPASSTTSIAATPRITDSAAAVLPKPASGITATPATPLVKTSPLLSLPSPISSRENPVVKKIEVPAGEILVDLYDNGEIDGDTVSIYHNNQLIVERAGLSDKPISFHFKADKLHQHHELTMVANNLGSIPPNTSVMIITAGNKRYEISISSSAQKNAKVVFDLKE